MIPALRRQNQADLCELETNLVYKSKLQDSQGYTEKPCLQKQTKKSKEKYVTEYGPKSH